MDPNAQNLPAQPAVVTTPPASTAVSATPGVNQTPKPKGKFLKVALFVFVGLFLFFTVVAGTTYAVAYEIVKLPSKDLQERISQAVVSLPFTPKTPKFLIGAISYAHKNIKSHSFDISFAAESEGFSSLGLNKLDLLAKGEIDYTNEQDPKFNVNVQATKDFSVDIKKGSPVVYFKINKIPQAVYSFAGLKEEDLAPFLNTWISFDTTPLETEARKNLDYYAQKESSKDSFFDEVSDTFEYEEILKDVKLTSEDVDGQPSHKLHLDTNKEILDYLQKELEKNEGNKVKEFGNNEKLSDQIKKMSIDFWVDKNKYFLRKMVISATINTDRSLSPNVISYLGVEPEPKTDVLGTTLEKNDYYISVAAKFNDFGKEIKVEEPATSKKWEDVVAAFMDKVYGERSAGGTGVSYYDTLRKSDLKTIATIIEGCYGASKKYPAKLSDVEKDCKEILSGIPMPVDPVTKKPYDYSPNAARTGYFLKATLSTGEVYTLTEKNGKSSGFSEDSFKNNSPSPVL